MESKQILHTSIQERLLSKQSVKSEWGVYESHLSLPLRKSSQFKKQRRRQSTRHLPNVEIRSELKTSHSPHSKTKRGPHKPFRKPFNTLKEMFGKDTDHYYLFAGLPEVETLWMYWLQDKYTDTLCTWGDGTSDGFAYVQFADDTAELHVDDRIVESIVECVFRSKSRYLMYIITITNDGSNAAHANALIIDLELCTMTRFEPNGSDAVDMYSHALLDDALRNWLQTNGRLMKCKEWTFVLPSAYCPMDGPQKVEYGHESRTVKYNNKNNKREDNGYCSAWSMLYIHFKLVNPDYGDDEIVEYILKRSPKDMAFMIRQYANTIMKEVGNPQWLQLYLRNHIQIGDYVHAFQFGVFNNNPVHWLSGRIINFKDRHGEHMVVVWPSSYVDADEPIRLQDLYIPRVNVITDIESQQKIDRDIYKQIMSWKILPENDTTSNGREAIRAIFTNANTLPVEGLMDEMNEDEETFHIGDFVYVYDSISNSIYESGSGGDLLLEGCVLDVNEVHNERIITVWPTAYADYDYWAHKEVVQFFNASDVRLITDDEIMSKIGSTIHELLHTGKYLPGQQNYKSPGPVANINTLADIFVKAV